jgi:hypothetical protein
MIDPVVLLIEQMRLVEKAMQRAARRKRSRPADAEVIDTYFWQMEKLRGELLIAIPTSALGAAELLRSVMP